MRKLVFMPICAMRGSSACKTSACKTRDTQPCRDPHRFADAVLGHHARQQALRDAQAAEVVQHGVQDLVVDRHGPVPASAPAVVQCIQLAFTARAQQEVHHADAPREQGLDEAFAEEAGGTGDQMLHGEVCRSAVPCRTLSRTDRCGA